MECDAAGSHVRSFDYFLETGIASAVADIRPRMVHLPNGEKLELRVSNPIIGYPSLGKHDGPAAVMGLYPKECRCRGISYKSKLLLTLDISVDGNSMYSSSRPLFEVPIMVMSQKCYLRGMKSEELIRAKEDAKEFGGYFIINGVERVLRLVVINRRNYPLAVERKSWLRLGVNYTPYGISIRCVREDHLLRVMNIHYLSTRRMVVCLFCNRTRMTFPFIILLKALVDATDRFIFEDLIRGIPSEQFWRGCVANMLIDLKQEGISTQDDALSCLGRSVRENMQISESVSDLQVGREFIEDNVAIHLDSAEDKFNYFVFCAQKLCALVKGHIVMENSDDPAYQEVLLPGSLMLLLLRDRIEVMLDRMAKLFSDEATMEPFKLTKKIRVHMARAETICNKSLEYVLATGNVPNNSRLFLSQTTGYSILAERINYTRFVSHFVAVRRSTFVCELRTSDARKMLTSSWGFLCPVHTPDGAQCGLLNHLASGCQVSTRKPTTNGVVNFLLKNGVVDVFEAHQVSTSTSNTANRCRVMVDGRIVGYVDESRLAEIERKIRAEKVSGSGSVFASAEVCLVTKTNSHHIYPGLFIFTNVGRLMRAVRNLSFKTPNNIEMIGTLEQQFLDICVQAEDYQEGVTTHQEVEPTAFLSFNANLIPFLEYNQSPRNIYQCQMGKQTVGTALLTIPFRADNKMYQLNMPQTPLVQNSCYEQWDMDSYPQGTNAIVAVISHTGYDMEDAMIINKHSVERGFTTSTIYKCERINLTNRIYAEKNLIFERDPMKTSELCNYLDPDGLPYVGRRCSENEPLVCYYSPGALTYTVRRYRSSEPAYVDSVKIIGSDSGFSPLNHVCITLRYRRHPIVGDKYASRHGQKGICSFVWPAENMPFSETGVVPDIIFNPHGFPSRMTVGMMIESIAGKGAALLGRKQKYTPFEFGEKRSAVEHFGKLMIEAGYNYCGNERMYNPIDGRSFEVDIFMGVVYYQRLRHMVMDKCQVRATGAIDSLTKQPVKGGKRGGGVRFGEMERDSLISHGTSFLLQDRLLNCSDKHYAYLCSQCGSFISPLQTSNSASAEYGMHNGYHHSHGRVCSICETADHIKRVRIPYVVLYLIAELSSVNIGMRFKLEE